MEDATLLGHDDCTVILYCLFVCSVSPGIVSVGLSLSLVTTFPITIFQN